MISDERRSATHSSASRRRKLRSVRQSLASSTAARARLPYFSSLPSKRSNSVNASAVPPANPASTCPECSRRTLRALPFMTVVPSVTWPSPPIATMPSRRTDRIVVPCGSKLAIGRGSSAGAAARARVGAVIDARKVLEVEVRVDLGGRDVGVAEQLLHAAQVLARLQQVGGERMAEQVRVGLHVEPVAARPAGDAQLDGARAEPPALASNEQRRVAGVDEAGAGVEPGADRGHRLLSDRHDPRLRSLPQYAHCPVIEVEVGKIKADELGEPQAARIEQLHDRPVA